MSKYSKEEIKVFEDKELRIVRQAILKKLIEKCKLEDVYEVSKVTELSEKYVDYVYEERRDKQEHRDSTKRKETTKRGQVASVGDDTEGIEAKPTSYAEWEQIALGLNLAIPNSQNIKILNQVADEYKKATKASANPKDILVHIINTFGKYPHNPESVSKVVESLNLKG